MLVRQSKLNDEQAIIDLIRLGHAESCWADEPFSEDRVSRTFNDMHRHENSVVLLACDGADVVGILVGTLQLSMFSLDYDAVEVLFYVQPNHRTVNTVRALVNAYEQWAKALGASAAHLSTSQLKNAERVTALYGKLGYGVSAFVHRKVLQ